MGIVNAGIGVMSVLLFAFIFSFSNRQTQTGVPIKAVTFPSSNETPKLATEIYEANPVLDIEIEILNGCGEPGVAARFSDFCVISALMWYALKMQIILTTQIQSSFSEMKIPRV